MGWKHAVAKIPLVDSKYLGAPEKGLCHDRVSVFCPWQSGLLVVKVIFLYIPCGSLAEAKRISKALLDRRLVACANIVKSASLYNWHGKRMVGQEYIIFAKTTREKSKGAEKAVKRLHSYRLPAIISFSARANNEYEGWVQKEVKR